MNLGLPMAGIMLSAPALLMLGLSSSPHCALMCAAMTQLGNKAGDRAAYNTLTLHLGRLAAYALLGALAGGIGAALLMALERYGVGTAVRWLAAGALLSMALMQWRTTASRPACCGPKPVLSRAPLPPFARGLLWGLLPCPLLWSVLGLVTLTGSTFQGALLTVSFGLGTSPLLLMASGAGAGLSQRLQERHRRGAAAAMLALAGIWIAATTPQWHSAASIFCSAIP